MNNYSLRYMLNVALKYWIFIVLAAILTASAAFSYFNFIAEPRYVAKGSIAVTNGRILTENTTAQKVENTDIVASLNLAYTVTDILKTPDIYKQLSDALDNKYSFEQLKGKTSISRKSDNTIFIDVTFTHSNPQETIEILNKYLEIAPGYVNTIAKDTSASVVTANSASWDYPSDIIIIGIGGIIGAVAMYIVIFLIYTSNNVIRDDEDYAEHCGMTVLGVVPDFVSSRASEKRYSRYGKYGYYSYSSGGKNDGTR